MLPAPLKPVDVGLDVRVDTRDGCDVLVAAAFAPELIGLGTLLGPAMRDDVGGLSVVARPVGIGLVAAAAGTASALAHMRPRAVVLVGTCGAYPDARLTIGDLIVARWVRLVEPAVLDDEAAFPPPMAVAHEATSALAAGLGAAGPTSATLVDVATTLGITTADPLAERLCRLSGTSVEHMEAFAVVAACVAQRTPVAVVLGVANAVGSRGRGEWRANHEAAGRAASACVASWLRAGAPGIPARR